MTDQQRFDATSDQRTVNNLMRHQYRQLTDEEKAAMIAIKDAGLEFVNLLHRIGGTTSEAASRGEEARQASRYLSLAQTAVEEAVMWATKEVTK